LKGTGDDAGGLNEEGDGTPEVHEELKNLAALVLGNF